MTESQKAKTTAREAARREKQLRLVETLRLKQEAEERGEDVERKKNWEWTIEENEEWEKRRRRKERNATLWARCFVRPSQSTVSIPALQGPRLFRCMLPGISLVVRIAPLDCTVTHLSIKCGQDRGHCTHQSGVVLSVHIYCLRSRSD